MTRISSHLKLAALSAALLLGACTSDKQAAQTTAPPVQMPPASTMSSVAPGSAQDFRQNVGDTVHFTFNEYNIQDNDRATLQHQAAWLAKYPSVRLTIEGDCDERGTREYNLALGARRANAVKEYLVSLGVSAGRLETISYGKERPVCSESTEDCWAQNRRGVSNISGGANS
jgi:peptidoglycan-associated lipoprotein